VNLVRQADQKLLIHQAADRDQLPGVFFSVSKPWLTNVTPTL
jgi:hypothetical protein